MAIEPHDIIAANELARVRESYASKGRYYHTWVHVEALLASARRDGMMLTPVVLAIIYHDIVYNASAKDNEARSAKALEAARENGHFTASANDVAEAATMINLGEGTPAVDWFWDADREILAADDAAYDAYAGAVRKEYSIYPDFMYKRGRAAFVKAELARPHIYRTPSFRARFDDRARANLSRELARL
ncbi:MAG: hypothetical protein JNM81_00930 [Rhodospirillaceae bacterium]|nr:hypothetical protein [Rhodospirillaceae bacterium]